MDSFLLNNTWLAILLTTAVGGMISTAVAALICYRAKSDHIPLLISFAVGSLLGAALLELLPHAIIESTHPRQITFFILAGIVLFFLLEKFMLWRHCHHEGCEEHQPKTQPVGVLSLLGDGVHSLLDGIFIAIAFLQDFRLGVITAIAIFAHEIPQEAGDFVILRHAGFKTSRAVLFNLLVNACTVAGSLLGYFFLSSLTPLIPILLALTVGNLIYVALSDLVPTLHTRTELRSALAQIFLISLGIFTIWAVEYLLRIGFGHGL